jgi:hypothetical protein
MMSAENRPSIAVAAKGDATPCFAVSLLKLSVMSLCTLGLYELFWFYKNWTIIKRREGTAIQPFWRAFFTFFFCYACFARIRGQAQVLHLERSIPAGALAVTWIVTNLLWRLPDPY